MKYDFPFADARPVMTNWPEHCPRCDAPESVLPVAQIVRNAEVRSVYECPRCLHAWWSARNTSVYAGWTPEVAA